MQHDKIINDRGCHNIVIEGVSPLMSLASLSSTTLHSLIKLVEKRDAIQAELAKVEGQIAAAYEGEATSTRTSISKAKPAPKTKRGKRGAVKEAVLAELKAAGKVGVSVKDLSAKLGIKNQNMHVWFGTTGKTIKGLKKVGKGQWALLA